MNDFTYLNHHIVYNFTLSFNEKQIQQYLKLSSSSITFKYYYKNIMTG